MTLVCSQVKEQMQTILTKTHARLMSQVNNQITKRAFAHIKARCTISGIRNIFIQTCLGKIRGNPNLTTSKKCLRTSTVGRQNQHRVFQTSAHILNVSILIKVEKKALYTLAEGKLLYAMMAIQLGV